MRRVPVVTLVDFAVGGGAERAAVDIARNLADGFAPIVVASREPRGRPATGSALDAAITSLETSGARYVALGRTRRLAIWDWLSLYRLLRRERVEVIHAHKFGSNLWAGIIGTLAGVPVKIANEHTPFGRERRGRRLVNGWVTARLVDLFVTVSEWSREAMIEHERIAPDRVAVIRNGIAPPQEPASDARRRITAELDLNPSAEIVLSVGMLRPEKRHDLLIEAIRTLRSKRPNVVALIAGGPNVMDPTDVEGALTAQLRRHGLEDHVRLLGRRQDVPDLIGAADVVVSTSDFENLPIAILEYMDAAKPIVATAVGGVPELLADGTHGRLVQPGNSEALAAAIGEVLADPTLAAHMGEAARRRRRTEFTLESTAAQFSALYDRLLRERHGARRG